MRKFVTRDRCRAKGWEAPPERAGWPIDLNFIMVGLWEAKAELILFYLEPQRVRVHRVIYPVYQVARHRFDKLSHIFSNQFTEFTNIIFDRLQVESDSLFDVSKGFFSGITLAKQSR